jgi:UPF0755 protein
MWVRVLLVVLLSVSLAAGWLWLDYRRFVSNPLPIGATGVTLTLAPGSSLRRVAQELVDKGLLEQPYYFRVLARLRGKADRLQAGEYHILPDTTPTALLGQLTSGRVVQYPLTLIEGWTFSQVLAAIGRDTRLRQTLEDLTTREVMARLGQPEQHPEGQFYPDTYHFPRGTSDLQFLRRAYETMQLVLAEEWKQRQPELPLTTPYEALTLASIIEKETGLASERAEIAGVFVRRLRLGMKLQTDPTVIYGLGSAFDGNLRRRDLVADTPYNTYVHSGLPPTPIAMPGRDSIHAALNPAAGKNLYFVARGDGSHQFSQSLAEHNRAVRKYQLKR